MQNETSCIHMNDKLWELRNDPTTRPITMAIFAIFYSIIILFGLIGNICVILAIGRNKSLQTVPNMFILSLSCSDVVVCCTSATITPITAFKKEWIFGGFLCSTAPFIAGVSLCFSTFTLTAISIDRFMLIRFPMKKPFTHTQALFVIFFICTTAASLSSPITFVMSLREIRPYCGSYCFEEWGPWGAWRRAYGTVVLIMQFIIPFSIIIICYAAISMRLGQSLLLKGKKQDYEWQFKLTDQQKLAMKRRQRTNRMFIAMVVAFSASWIWSVLFNVLRDYEMLPDFFQSQEYIFGILTHCIAMTSTVWNPLLYAMLNLQLRAAFIQLIPKCLKPWLCCKFARTPENSEEIRRRTKITTAAAVRNGITRDSYPNERNGCLHSQLPLLPNEMSMYENAETIAEEHSKYGAFDSTRKSEIGTIDTNKNEFHDRLSDNFCETNEDRLPFNFPITKAKLQKTTSSNIGGRHTISREHHKSYVHQNPHGNHHRRSSYATFFNHPQNVNPSQNIDFSTQHTDRPLSYRGPYERRSSSGGSSSNIAASNGTIKPAKMQKNKIPTKPTSHRFSSVSYKKEDGASIISHMELPKQEHCGLEKRASSPILPRPFRHSVASNHNRIQDDQIRLLD